jgi:extradiol dioxygenase family protein
MSKLAPFHLAIPVYDLEKARDFYTRILGCSEGRSDKQWVDLNFYGHQLVIHVKPVPAKEKIGHSNPVDNHEVPIPHFGVVLDWKAWQALAIHLKNHKIKFDIDPYIRFEGKVGEQATMFFRDPSGNALEFKAFKNLDQLFAK